MLPSTAARPRRRGLQCGIHAWHPRRRSARRVLGAAAEVAGVVEAGGAVEVHRDGFRAERRARSRSSSRPGGRGADRAGSRRRTRAEVVPARGPDAVVAWCRERGLGLEPAVVDELLGPRAARRGAPRAAPHPAARGGRRWSRSRCCSSIGLAARRPGRPDALRPHRRGAARARRSGGGSASTAAAGADAAALPTRDIAGCVAIRPRTAARHPGLPTLAPTPDPLPHAAVDVDA